jgi:hypothetical protein
MAKESPVEQVAALLTSASNSLNKARKLLAKEMPAWSGVDNTLDRTGEAHHRVGEAQIAFARMIMKGRPQ